MTLFSETESRLALNLYRSSCLPSAGITSGYHHTRREPIFQIFLLIASTNLDCSSRQIQGSFHRATPALLHQLYTKISLCPESTSAAPSGLKLQQKPERSRKGRRCGTISRETLAVNETSVCLPCTCRILYENNEWKGGENIFPKARTPYPAPIPHLSKSSFVGSKVQEKQGRRARVWGSSGVWF